MSELDVHAGGTEIRVPKDFTWPGGKRIAVFLRVAFEWWSDDKWPGISPMGNPLRQGFPDLNARGFAQYGYRRGIHRALDVLKRHGVRATVVVNGILAERFPQIVRRIADEGHDIVAHSYAMDVIPVYLNEQEEADNIRRTTELIEKAAGVRPKGWISPRGTPSPRTVRLLIDHGYEWHGDTLNDDLPYMVRFGAGKSIIAIPGTMEINDLPLYMRYGNSPRQMLEMFEDWLCYVRKYEHEAKIDPTIHAHVFGRPALIWAYDRIIEIAKSAEDIWLGTRSEAAAHVRRCIGQ
jgi:peptidoglycan/xylan/chitin deacetylase (PgdA/CDA1 family)